MLSNLRRLGVTGIGPFVTFGRGLGRSMMNTGRSWRAPRASSRWGLRFIGPVCEEVDPVLHIAVMLPRNGYPGELRS